MEVSNKSKRRRDRRNEKVPNRNVDIEASLREQREILQTQAPEHLNLHHPDQNPQIKGFIYDENLDRYFKSGSHGSRSPKRNDPTNPRYGSACEFLRTMHQREIRPHFASQFRRSLFTHIQTGILQQYPFHVTTDNFDFHPNHGIVRISKKQVIFGMGTNATCYNLLRAQETLQSVGWFPGDIRAVTLVATGVGRGSSLLVLQPSQPASSSEQGRSVHGGGAADRAGMRHHRIRLPRDSIQSSCWVRGDGSKVLLGCDAALVEVDVEEKCAVSRWATLQGSAAVAMCPGHSRFSTGSDVALVGLRNGSVTVVDMRTSGVRTQPPTIPAPASTRATRGPSAGGGGALFAMPFCLDHLAVLRDGVSVVAQDITGKVSVFDIRYSQMEYMSVLPSSSQVRGRRFWLAPDDQSLLCSHPLLAPNGVSLFSLAHPSWVLGSTEVPSTRRTASSSSEGTRGTGGGRGGCDGRGVSGGAGAGAGAGASKRSISCVEAEGQAGQMSSVATSVRVMTNHLYLGSDEGQEGGGCGWRGPDHHQMVFGLAELPHTLRREMLVFHF